MNWIVRTLLSGVAVVFVLVSGATAQHEQHGVTNAESQQSHSVQHSMLDLGRGWMAVGMAQGIPVMSVPLPRERGTPLEAGAFYFTQPALMFNIEAPASRFALRTTLNFEGLTIGNGEMTFGGWGEGFIDKRHPHTLLHEAMLSWNVLRGDGRGFSISAGKGFAPYGTDDPMARPVLKYPTNHHLSQVLERWTLNGVVATTGWSFEAGLFGGGEPDGPYDFSNIESFGDSWSARLTRRIGSGAMGSWPWELSASFASVQETHDNESQVTRLYNVAVRHEQAHGFGRLYALLEASRSDPEHHAGYYSVAGETLVRAGRHMPYARVEVATRPEFAREGAGGDSGFFRYDHDAAAIGSTRWLIASAGYGFVVTNSRLSVRPFVEAQFNRVKKHEGNIAPESLFGRSRFWTLSMGARVFLGGEPMRMGAYGVLDPMTAMHRMQMVAQSSGEHRH